MNIMLVDDYPLIVNGLESIFKNQPDFVVAAKAYNGEEALKILEKQDIQIIITDMKMPVMNGLELISAVKKNYPHIRIAVLSSYDDFDLARSAFQLGADNYILKLEMDKEKVLEICRKIKEDIEWREKSAHDSSFSLIYSLNELIDEKEKLEESFSLQQRQSERDFFAELVSNRGIDADEIFQKHNSLYDKFQMQQFLLVIIKAESPNLHEQYNKNNIILYMLQKQCDSLLGESSVPFYIFEVSAETFALVIVTSDSLQELLIKVHSAIRDELFSKLSIVTSCGVSVRVNLNELSTALEQASLACNYRLLKGKGNILFFDDIKEQNCLEKIDFEEKLTFFKDTLNSKNPKQLIEQIDFFSVQNSQVSITELKKVYALYQQYLWGIILFIEKNSLSINVDNIFMTYQFFENAISIRELNNWLKDTLILIATNYEEDSRYISMIKHYVEQHYMDSDLSIEHIAKKMGFSNGYLGKLIKNKINCHFSDYLNNFRVQKAKELINSSTYKIYEISSMVGYSNVEHFTRVFKRIVGCSPSSYK